MSGPLFHMISTGPRPVAPFSHAVESDGWVILTGQMPTDPAAPDAPLPDGIGAQTRRVMENLKLILGGVGLDLSHVLQCRCYRPTSSAISGPSTRPIKAISRPTGGPPAPPSASPPWRSARWWKST